MDQVLADTLTANLKAAKTPEAQTGALTLVMIAWDSGLHDNGSSIDTNDLERARATIDLYSARRQLQRADAAQTNIVTVIITP